MIVSHYGVHWADGDIAFLEQEGGGTTAVGSLIESPFQVKNRLRCPHRIDLDQPTPEGELPDDPLIDIMSPVPGPGVFYLEGNHSEVLTALARMSAPLNTGDVIRPIWMDEKISAVQRLMGLTNAQPLVLTGVTSSHTKRIRQIADMGIASPRRVLLVGGSDVVIASPIQIVKTNLTDLDHPWEAWGAELLRRYMRSSTTNGAQL